MRLRRRKPEHPDWWGRPTEPLPFVLVLPPKPWPEPWRSNPDAFLVSRKTLTRFVQPEQLIAVAKNEDRLAWIAESMDIDGVKQPLELVVDSYGVIVLRDGHHRLICAERIGMPELPVVLTDSHRAMTGVHVYAVLRELIERK